MYEDWIVEIEKNKWAYSIVPLHQDKQEEAADTSAVSLVLRIEIETEPDVSISKTNQAEGYTFVTPAYFVFNIELDHFISMFYSGQNTDTILITEENGKLLFCNDQNVTNAQFMDLLEQNINLKKDGNTIIEIDNEKKLISWQYSQITQMTSIIFVENDELIEDIDRIFILMLLSVFFLLGIFVIMISIVLKKITNPINKLATAMSAIDADGRGNKVVVNSGDEIGILGSKFNEMLDQIENLLAEIRSSYEKQQQLEYGVLEAQINPHFIYNTLNSIRNIALIQKSDTVAMAIRSLISLLQSSIKIGENFISIKQELEQLKNYIVLQSMRYLDSFTVTYDIDPEVLPCKTIKFLLQSLVENAIYHGIEPKQKQGTIHVSIQSQNSVVVYRVEDNGVGIGEDRLIELRNYLNSKEGIQGYNKVGLKNVDERIKLYFGQQYGITIESRRGEGMVVKLVIPKMLFEENEEAGGEDE